MSRYLTPSTWGGSDLNNASWLAMFAPGQIEGSVEVGSVNAAVMGDYPAFVDVDWQARRFALWMFGQGNGAASTRREEVTRWFAAESGRQTLVASDLASGSRQLTCLPLSVQAHPDHPQGFIITLEATDPIWQRSNTCSVSASITSASTDISVSPAGNIFAKPVIAITPRSSKIATDVNRYEVPFSACNQLDWALYNYPLEVTDGGWDTATLISAGSMQSDGDDIRVIWHEQEVDHWLNDINSSSTKVWAIIDLEASESASGKIVFGNLSASAKSVNSDLKPIFDLGKSTNEEWVYNTGWGSNAGTRPGSWQRSFDGTTLQSWHLDWGWIAQGGASSGTWQDADPWREPGIRKRNDLWGQSNLHNGYLFTTPVGVSSMKIDLSRRLYGSGSRSRMQWRFRSASAAEAGWSYFWEDTVDTSSAWTALTSSSWTPWTGCAREVQFRVTTPWINGSGQTPDDWGFYLTAASVRLKNYPNVTACTQGAMYHLTASLANTSVSPNQSIALNAIIGVNQTLEIDTEAHTVTNTTTGCWLNQAISLDSLRRDWLTLLPSTCNNLNYNETNVVDTTVTITWRDRWI